MNTLISLLFLTLQLQSAPTAPAIVFEPCDYFEMVDGPASNIEVCCFTLATTPGVTITMIYANADGIEEGPEEYTGESGFIEVCMPLKFTSVVLNHPKLDFPCIMENPCN